MAVPAFDGIPLAESHVTDNSRRSTLLFSLSQLSTSLSGDDPVTGEQRPPPNLPSVSPNTQSVPCPVCGKMIYGRNRRQGLERHLRTHTKEKPYQCPICPHRASMQHNMRHHIFSKHSAEMKLDSSSTSKNNYFPVSQ